MGLLLRIVVGDGSATAVAAKFLAAYFCQVGAHVVGIAFLNAWQIVLAPELVHAPA